MANITYYKYTYNGVNDFVSPIYDQEISEIKAFVNDIEVTFAFLTDTSIQLTVEPTIGDIVEVLRETYKENPLVDFTNGSILNEKSLDLQGNQIFNLIEELNGNDTKNKTYLEEQINTSASNLISIDSSAWSGNLTNNPVTIQDALDEVDALVLDSADPSKINLTVAGTGNIPTSGTLSEIITQIDNLDTDDYTTVTGSTGSIPDGVYKLEDVTNYLSTTKTSNNETTGDDVTVTSLNPQTGLEETNSLTITLNNLNSVKPTISSSPTGTEESQLILTITNYNPTSSYEAIVIGGTIDSIVGDTITWTLPTVTVDTDFDISVYATDFGLIKSVPSVTTINVTNIPIVPDVQIVYNANFDGANTENNVGMDITTNVLKPLQDNATIESIHIDQEGIDGDFVSYEETLTATMKPIGIEAGSTNIELQTLDLIVQGEETIINDIDFTLPVITEGVGNVGDGLSTKIQNNTFVPILSTTGASNSASNGTYIVHYITNGGSQAARFEIGDDGTVNTYNNSFFQVGGLSYDDGGHNVKVDPRNGTDFIFFNKYNNNGIFTTDKFALMVRDVNNSMAVVQDIDLGGFSSFPDNGANPLTSVTSSNEKMSIEGNVVNIAGNMIFDDGLGPKNAMFLIRYDLVGATADYYYWENNTLDTVHSVTSDATYTYIYYFDDFTNQMKITKIINSTGAIDVTLALQVESSGSFQVGSLKIFEGNLYLFYEKYNLSELFVMKLDLNLAGIISDLEVPLGSGSYSVDYHMFEWDTNLLAINTTGGNATLFKIHTYNTLTGAFVEIFDQTTTGNNTYTLFMEDSKNFISQYGTGTTAHMYRLGTSPGQPLYKADISPLGLGVAPTTAFFKPLINFKNSMTPNNTTSNLLVSTPTSSVGSGSIFTMDFPKVSTQGRSYKWSVEIVDQNKVVSVDSVITDMEKLQS